MGGYCGYGLLVLALRVTSNTESNIQVVKIKLVSVCATRFSPNLDADSNNSNK